MTVYTGDLDDCFISGAAYLKCDVIKLYLYTSAVKTSLVSDYGLSASSIFANEPLMTAIDITTGIISVTQNVNNVVRPARITGQTGGITYDSVTGAFTLESPGLYFLGITLLYNPNASGNRSVFWIDNSGVQYGRYTRLHAGASSGVRMYSSSVILHDGMNTLTVTPIAFHTATSAINILASVNFPILLSIVRVCG